MASRIPEHEETELNMTPMIDVVFQLIVFFLLSLKFKSVDQRIDSNLPLHKGIDVSREFIPETPHITVKLFREDVDRADEAFTKVRVANVATIRLPPPDDVEGRDQAASQVREAILGLWAARDHDPEVQGEIKTPGPKGTAVPHGDVMLVLDAFLAADLANVEFEGSHSPMPPGYDATR